MSNAALHSRASIDKLQERLTDDLCPGRQIDSSQQARVAFARADSGYALRKINFNVLKITVHGTKYCLMIFHPEAPATNQFHVSL